jgi:hypothetical protein
MLALGPVVACGVALQQLLELLDPVLERFARGNKEWILSAVALGVALLFSAGVGLRVLAPLGYPEAGLLDLLATALFMTAGTRGANDLLKWLGYKKSAARRAAAGAPPRSL